MPLDNPPVHYACQRCGNCCRWPGDVIVTEQEVSNIAAFLQMDEQQFIDQLTRLSANRRHLSLIDKEDGSCYFLEGKNHCQLQDVKPHQCKGFPNQWRFPGWQDICEAIEVPAPAAKSSK